MLDDKIANDIPESDHANTHAACNIKRLAVGKIYVLHMSYSIHELCEGIIQGTDSDP